MLKSFSQSFPGYLSTSYKSIIKYTFIAGLCVFLVVASLAPFGLSKLPLAKLFLDAAFFGVTTFAVTFTNSVLWPIALPNLFKEESWTVYKELLMMIWHIVTITFANLFLVHFLYESPITLYYFLKIGAITTSIGIIPVSLSIFIKQNLLLAKYNTVARTLNAKLSPVDETLAYEGQPAKIVLHGTNKGEVVEIALSTLLYLEAEQNYVKIVTESSKPLRIRSTLKQVEAKIQVVPSLYRCHRAFVINLAKVEQISGNAQGLKLHFSKSSTLIPVSRNYNKEIADRLQALKGHKIK